MQDLASKVKQAQSSFAPAAPSPVGGCPSPASASPVPSPPPSEPEPEASPAEAAPAKAEEKPKQKSWVEIVLVDMDNKPVSGVRYRIEPPGGEPREGYLNEFGQAGYYEIEPGSCKVSFPDLDKEAWEAA